MCSLNASGKKTERFQMNVSKKTQTSENIQCRKSRILSYLWNKNLKNQKKTHKKPEEELLEIKL